MSLNERPAERDYQEELPLVLNICKACISRYFQEKDGCRKVVVPIIGSVVGGGMVKVSDLFHCSSPSLRSSRVERTHILPTDYLFSIERQPRSVWRMYDARQSYGRIFLVRLADDHQRISSLNYQPISACAPIGGPPIFWRKRISIHKGNIIYS